MNNSSNSGTIQQETQQSRSRVKFHESTTTSQNQDALPGSVPGSTHDVPSLTMTTNTGNVSLNDASITSKPSDDEGSVGTGKEESVSDLQKSGGTSQQPQPSRQPTTVNIQHASSITTNRDATSTNTTGALSSHSSHSLSADPAQRDMMNSMGSAMASNTTLRSPNDASSEMGSFLPPEARIEENQAKSAAQKKSRALSLSLLAVATIIAIIAGVITGVIVYLASVRSLEQTALEKGEAILEGASMGVNDLNNRLIMNVEQQANFVQAYEGSFQDQDEASALFNETLFRQWTSRIHEPNEIYSLTIRFFYPPIPDDQFIPQEKEKQLGCQDICARPGDPTYTHIASWSVWYDIAANGEHEYAWAQPQSNGQFSDVYRLTPEDTPNRLLRMRERLYRYSTISKAGVNGSFTDGYWFRPKLWPSSDNSSYYYFTHVKLFRHQNVSFVSNAYSTPHNWFSVLQQLIKTSNKEFLVLTDGFDDRVLTFSAQQVADKRLWNCSFDAESTSEGTDGPTKCVDLSAKNHEHWLIRSLYNDHESFVKGATADTRGKWSKLSDGNRYMILTKEIFHRDQLRVIATYAMHEDQALQDLESQTIPTVVISAMIVVISSTFLAAVGFIMIRRTHKTLEIVAEVAFHISRYDIENGEAVLQRSREADDGNDALRGEFGNILENLRAYRAFLPAALQHPDPLFDSVDCISSGDGSSNADTNPLSGGSSPKETALAIAKPSGDAPKSPLVVSDGTAAHAGFGGQSKQNVFATHRLRTTHLRSVRGTVMLIDIGDINTKHTTPSTQAINTFFGIAIDCVKEQGGVVDSLAGTFVTVSFNYHLPCVKHEESACRCAVTMTSRLNHGLSKFNIHAAISIASGFNLVGTCGTEQQKSRVVVGEAVDMLKKMSALQRRLNCEIIVSEQVAAGTNFSTAAVDIVAPCWISKSHHRAKLATLFELRPVQKNADRTAPLINQAMQLMRVKKPDEALAALAAAAKAADDEAGDRQVKRLIEVCETQREKILLGYSRSELHWEAMESGTHLEGFLSGSGNSGTKTHSQSSTVEIISDDTRKARKELKEQQKSKEINMQMKDEEEGATLFSIFVAEPKEEEKTDDYGLDKFEIPKSFKDVHEEEWTRCSELIGRGQFGEVYTCISETGTLCALKAFPISSNFVVETLVRETDTLQKMRHEHVAGYVSCAVLENHFMIMMEYLAAGTLRKMIGNVGMIPTRAAHRYLQDILQGLVFLHENDLAHCDLKPDNCLFAGDGTCKLADFGTAKLLTNESMSGMVRGTPRYMAPEAALGDWRMPADIYSIGIILIEMVTGKNPWSHIKGDDNAFLMRLTSDDTMAPQIPQEMDVKLKGIAVDCLQREPKQRPTAEELLGKLQMI